jgi:hypothetical protein
MKLKEDQAKKTRSELLMMGYDETLIEQALTGTKGERKKKKW